MGTRYWRGETNPNQTTVGERQSLLFPLVVATPKYVCLPRDGLSWQSKGLSHTANLITDAYHHPKSKERETFRFHLSQRWPKLEALPLLTTLSFPPFDRALKQRYLPGVFSRVCSFFSVLVAFTGLGLGFFLAVVVDFGLSLPRDPASFVLTTLTETLLYFFLWTKLQRAEAHLCKHR